MPWHYFIGCRTREYPIFSLKPTLPCCAFSVSFFFLRRLFHFEKIVVFKLGNWNFFLSISLFLNLMIAVYNGEISGTGWTALCFFFFFWSYFVLESKGFHFCWTALFKGFLPLLHVLIIDNLKFSGTERCSATKTLRSQSMRYQCPVQRTKWCHQLRMSD